MDDLMKNNSVTMIEIVKLTKEQNDFVENKILPSMRRIFDENDDKYIAVEEIDGRDVMFLFVEQHKVDLFIEFLNDNKLLHSSRNVTEDILMGNLDDTELEEMMKCEEFKSIFESFLLKNLDADKVLDKINLNGINKLTDVDKIVLERGM